VQPLAARGQLIGLGWKARRDEPGRQGTLQHVETNRIGQRRLQTLEARSFLAPQPERQPCWSYFSSRYHLGRSPNPGRGIFLLALRDLGLDRRCPKG
jgi:hypothetical protein